MKTIRSNIYHGRVVNKSRFITFLYKANNLDEVNNYLDDIKKDYKDATHRCYAYIVDNVKRFNDDGEPGGTAGMPILNVLESNDLNYVLCVVVRYFGGVKLGAGGLVRAYTNSVTSTLSQANIVELQKGYKVKITFNYDLVKSIDNLVKETDVLNKEFNELITYELLVDDELLIKLKNICELEIIENLYI